MVKITADSTCDLPIYVIKDLDIEILPLRIIVGNDTFRDGVDINPTDIFRYVDLEGKSCQTAAVNLYEYQNAFERLAAQYDGVIHIDIGSGFSSCYQNASLAAQDFDNVFVIDSLNLCSGTGYLAHEGALLAKQGKSAHEIKECLQAMVPKLESSFVVDKLDYLRKGGRCSAVAEQGARLLQIKPCIEVVNNRMIVGKKYRGSLARCLQHYIEDRFRDRTDIDYRRVYVTHSCSPEIYALAKENIAHYAPFEEVVERHTGCTISNHCGPNTLGIFFMRK